MAVATTRMKLHGLVGRCSHVEGSDSMHGEARGSPLFAHEEEEGQALLDAARWAEPGRLRAGWAREWRVCDHRRRLTWLEYGGDFLFPRTGGASFAPKAPTQAASSRSTRSNSRTQKVVALVSEGEAQWPCGVVGTVCRCSFYLTDV